MFLVEIIQQILLMDEFSSLIALPYNHGNLFSEQPAFSCANSPGIELLTNTRSIFSEPSLRKGISGFNLPQNGAVLKTESGKSKDSDSCFNLSEVNNGDNPKALVGCSIAGIVNSQYPMNGANVSFCLEGCIDVETNSDPLLNTKHSDMDSTISSEVSQETKTIKQKSPLTLLPLWGSTSICGRRAEMEDSFVALPRFLQIPSQMLSDSPDFISVGQDLVGHVFGVYDGHGGCEVSNYCRERLHLALAHEICVAKQNLHVEAGECNSLNQQWLKVFRKCFRRLDNEVGGFSCGDEDVASIPLLSPTLPDSVGSTAVVAVVCATHIILANCGDSRAVLNRGKVSVPLSVDHKPNREDECARIEAEGGMIINWDGYRVSGVLAVSRSIGDRYLRPYVISDPEITIVPRTREDECLTLATDGLWDVMTNEEACDLARRRLLLWHKKNGPPNISKERGNTVDPAAQDAADYLSRVAFQRGSRDNISVIVVDLKAQRKFKKKNLKV